MALFNTDLASKTHHQLSFMEYTFPSLVSVRVGLVVLSLVLGVSCVYLWVSCIYLGCCRFVMSVP